MIIISVQILKSGVITASGSGVNPNLTTWGYSRNPNFPNTAGTTILSVSAQPDYTRYTATTAGNNGGKYGYPTGTGDAVLKTGTVYTWSIEARASTPITFTSGSLTGRMGFEGGGMLSGSSVSIGTEWTRIYNTWTQTTSKAFVFYPCGCLPNNAWVDLRNLKLEEGSIATPFVIPENESNYTGNVHGLFESSITPPASIGDGYIKVSEFIEI